MEEATSKYDVIFVMGELFFDHPMSGVAILKRVLEKEGYSVGVIEQPQDEDDIKRLGKPKLFFAISSGAIDSMVRNYTPLKRKRDEDKNLDYDESVPNRAVTVYCNWIRKHFKESKLVLGGTEASLRRFTHFDYWDNKLRRPILFDSRADILAYGSGEKQIIDIAHRIKNQEDLVGIKGTCIISKEKPHGFIELPSFEEVSESKEKFCDMQNIFTVRKNLMQQIDNRYLLQYEFPTYTSKDLDEYYEMPFSRALPKKLRGFEFSVVTHRGCVGRCSFCALTLLQGDKIISRSEASILRELKYIASLPHFKGNIDDLGGPAANMYGMDCIYCEKDCITCDTLNRSNKRLLRLMKHAREIPGIKNVYVRSGVRYDMCTKEYLHDLVKYHTYETLRIAPEHVDHNVLKAMNKDYGDLDEFIKNFNEIKSGKKLSFYFMTAHPGSTIKEAKELAKYMKNLENSECVQIFIPTPMTNSTCMYYTSLDPRTKKEIYVPYTYNEKKEQKRVIFNNSKDSNSRSNHNFKKRRKY